MAQLTEFGKAVKHRLIDIGETQSWLEKEVQKKTGKYMDCSYMYRILTGKESGTTIKPAIREILNIEERKEGST